ncbi:MAG: TIR domain-containing protein [Hyphomonadaceae bacterium]
MSVGFVLASEADFSHAQDIAAGFGLEAIRPGAFGGQGAAVSALQAASNVGIIISHAATRDAPFVALLLELASSLRSAQLILATADARGGFAFLPEAWPAMSLTDASARAADLSLRRAAPLEPAEPARAHPLPANEPPPDSAHPVVRMATIIAVHVNKESDVAQRREALTLAFTRSGGHVFREGDALLLAEFADANGALAVALQAAAHQFRFGVHFGEVSEEGAGDLSGETIETAARLATAAGWGELLLSESVLTRLDAETAAQFTKVDPDEVKGADAALNLYRARPERDDGAASPLVEAERAPPARPSPPHQSPPIAATPPQTVPAPASVESARAGSSAPADATAFAPKKLRRGSPELIRVFIHQPADLKAVTKTAKQTDPRAEPAPGGMRLGDVPLGASVGVSLEVHGAACDGALQRRRWAGEPLDFSFSAEPDEEVKQVVFLARVFIDDAQIGVLAFTRPVGGAHKQPHGAGDRVRLKRHKRVFLSYSSSDRETVAAIATAYQAAGVAHFFDRTSLKSGEEWSPRLRREIDQADLFHLCWSKSAAASDWVEKEAEHALSRRRRSNGKKPDITVQMLDGPPWAPHPPHLDSINFDDFVRAAIVGYARGDGA